jgi:hypothetical protein
MATSITASVLAWRPAHPRAAAVGIVAMVLAAAAFSLHRAQPAAPEVLDVPAAAQKRSELEHCTQGALLFHDVRWAAACMVLAEQHKRKHAACVGNPSITGNQQLGQAYCDATFEELDGSPDCDLPNAHAANLYALLQEAERKCMVEWAGPVR